MQYQKMEKEKLSMKLNTVIDDIRKYLDILLKRDRKKHTFGVLNFSLLLNEKHNLNLNYEKIKLAALAHDMFRDVDERKIIIMAKVYRIKIDEIEMKKPVLLHSKVAAEYLKRKINWDEDINDVLEAISYHTSGKVGMGTLAKVIFIADSLEENRDFPGIEKLRKIAFEDFELGFFEVLKNKLKYIVSNDLLLLPESVELWNSIVLNRW